MSTSYSKEKEKTLLERWKKQAFDNGDYNFTYDGLLFRGRVEQDEKLQWFYQSGNEETMWKQNPGLLFITKDVNGESNDDIRTWTGRQNGIMCTKIADTKHGCRFFFPNLMRWTYGLNALLNNKNPLCFSQITDEMAINAFDNTPVARINCKKEAGRKRCTNGMLDKYFLKNGYYKLLQEEILLFADAKIIYCGGAKVKEIVAHLFPLEPVNTGFCKQEKYIYLAHIISKEVLLINGYHPSYPGTSGAISQDDAYDELIWNVKAAMQIMKQRNDLTSIP